MPTLAPGSTVSFPLQVDQVLTLTNNFSTGNVVLSAQKSGDVVFNYTNEQMQDSPVFSPGSQGIVTINNATGFLTYNVTSSAFPLFENTPRTIFQSAIPFILAGGTAGGGTNQFTISATGGITALPTFHAPASYPYPAFMYMPAIAGLGGGTAGWFYASITGANSAQLYLARYTSGDPMLAVPTTLVLPSGVTAGNITQSTSAITAMSFTVPGGTIGPNGLLRANMRFEALNNANTKTVAWNFNSASGAGAMTSAATGGALFEVRAMNSQFRAMATPRSFSAVYGTSGNAPQYVDVDYSVATQLNVTLQLSTTTDFLTLAAMDAVVQYGA